VTAELLDCLRIPYLTLSSDEIEATRQISKAIKTAKQTNQAFALLVEKDVLMPHKASFKKSRVLIES